LYTNAVTRFALTVALAAVVAVAVAWTPASRASSPAPPAPSERVLRLRRGDLDTRSERARRMAGEADKLGGASDLYVVQFEGPVLDAWREAAAADGLDVLAPVPNDALLVRGSTDALARFAARPYVAWRGRFGRDERLDPDLDAALSRGEGRTTVAVELVDDAAGAALADRLVSVALARFAPPSRVGRFLVVRATLPLAVVADLLERPEVVDVEAWRAPAMQDERAGVISAGMLDATGTQPNAPGYLDWLASLGFDGRPFDFGIDFADSGLDTGVPGGPGSHPDLRGPDGATRVAYAVSFVSGSSGDPGDYYGHGTLNATIAAGYDAGAGAPFVDDRGYHLGLGVAPFARVGGSKIFDRGDSINLTTSYAEIAAHGYRNGMRVSSNSWGAPANRYTIDSQEYDAIVRDADASAPGNQEYTVVFAAGNAYGGGTILTPASAKNVITVGASENYRPAGVVDGCGVGDDGADSADDVVDFSSGGPLDDGRAKPDLVAPGTHMQSAASQDRFFNGQGICVDADFTRYFPYGQTLYAWASGTSQATPVVAGAAALVRAYTTMKALLPGGAAPSPAMVKATLLASATPMRGARAGATLPDARQGFGRVDLAPVVDDAARVLVDQTERFGSAGESFTAEGDVGDPARPFRVALVWTDAPGLPNVAPQVNDLDLEVRVGDTLYRGNAYTGFVSTPNPSAAPDALNTAETVTIPAGVRGHFTVTVRAATIAGDGVPGDADPTDQDFALVVYNVDDGRWTPPPAPVVASVTPKTRAGGLKLIVAGERLTAASAVELNGARVPADRVRFVERRGTLKVRGPASAIGLVAGENSLVVVDGDVRSEPFVFRYAP
jgi:hypothetical protein